MELSKLRSLIPEEKLSKLNDIEYAAYKKEIGALELAGLDNYILDILNSNIKVSNTSNSLVAWLIGITDEEPEGTMEYVGGGLPD